jgi:hypothetical protein
MASQKNERLEMVRNIVNEMDVEINSVNGTIDYLQKQKQSEINQKLLLEYNQWLTTLKQLRNFVIYKA